MKTATRKRSKASRIVRIGPTAHQVLQSMKENYGLPQTTASDALARAWMSLPESARLTAMKTVN